jgi:hypothetical protein
MERVDRSTIKGAPYNPRKIDERAREKLENGLRRVGLLAPITVNRRTGFIVGGHQRLAAIDAIEGSDQYALDVAMVDLTDQEERESNVFLNNASAQGEWDMEALEAMLKDGMDIAAAGFDELDAQMLFSDAALSPMFANEMQPESVQAAVAELTEIEKATYREKRKDYRERIKERDDSEFYAVVVFKDREAQTAFVVAAGYPDNARYLDGDRLASRLKPA